MDDPRVSEVIRRGTNAGEPADWELFESWRDSLSNEELKWVLLDISEERVHEVNGLLYDYWRRDNDTGSDNET